MRSKVTTPDKTEGARIEAIFYAVLASVCVSVCLSVCLSVFGGQLHIAPGVNDHILGIYRLYWGTLVIHKLSVI